MTKRLQCVCMALLPGDMPTAKELAEREGFEPSERLRAQRFSSSKILMTLCAVS